MKARIKKKGLSAIVVVVLVCTMMLASACSGFFISPGSGKKSPVESDSDDYIINHETGGADKSELVSNLNEDVVIQESGLTDNDYVNYIIEVDETSLYSMYQNRKDNSTSYQDYVSTRSARISSENMQKKHSAVFNLISKKIEAGFVASYTGIFNGFAVSVKYGDRDTLKKIAMENGGIRIEISESYATPTYETVSNEVDVWDTGIFKRADGFDYQGENMVVAVLDTGIDYEHDAFSEENLPENKDGLRKKSDIEAVLSKLSANKNTIVTDSGTVVVRGTTKLTISDVYVNEKVVYAYDYGDWKPEVNSTEQNAHGTHVTGIIVGRSDDPTDKDGNPVYDNQGRVVTGIEGVAPLAQIISMKVFSDFKSGAEDSSIYSALEDCVLLKPDVINMSLGLSNGFSDQDDNYFQQRAYEAVNDAGISLVVSAGNAYSSGMGGHWGLNLASNPDSGTIGSPSSLYQSFSVASINGVDSKYISATNGRGGSEAGIAYITESGKANGDRYEFIKDLISAIKGNNKNGTQYPQYYDEATGDINIPFVIVSGIGQTSDYAGLNVSGKIALVPRGKTTFTEKLKIAKSYNALGAIVYNNVGGIISMSIDDDVYLPSCSITMDAFNTIKKNLTDVRNGYFYMNESLGAGPFMSDFSSWGPTPSLELKPEITGHGGEIYSAFPGGHYDRISGTSMSSPNIAGLVILARQHVIKNAAKYEVLKSDGQIDNSKVEARVYQLMMSTATVPKNEDGNPYSPRKIGAGLADIGALMRTDAYVYVKDYVRGEEATGKVSNVLGTQATVKSSTNLKDDKAGYVQNRTKLQLYDDKARTGVYEMEFYVRNLGTTELKYNLRSITMTESMATDGKTVAEKSFMFTDSAKEWKVNDQVVTDGVATVAAESDVKITLKLTLTASEKAYLEKTFENGMYVEGYVRLDAIGQGENLGVPYLAFYGDWNDAPMFDYSIYETDKDDKDQSLNEDDKRFSQSLPTLAFGKLTENGYDYTIAMGTSTFAEPEDIYGRKPYENQTPYATMDRTTLSLGKDSLYELEYVAGFLRGAKTVNWQIRNKSTGQLMKSGTNINCRKRMGIRLEIDPETIGCKNGATYTFSFTADLDYPKSDGTESNSWEFDFTIDTDAPIITNAEIRVEKNVLGNYKRYLDFYIHDDNYIQAMSFNIYDKYTKEYESIWEKGMRPINSIKNGTTRVTYDLSDYWERLRDNDFKISTRLYDYALNNSYYEIDLSKVLYTGALSLNFADIGQYKTYSLQGASDYKVMVGNYEEIPYNADGSYNSMTYINIVKNQSVKLEYAVVARPDNVWTEDLDWTATGSAVEVNPKTGEIFARQSGTSYVTVKSKRTGISATITVNVLRDSVIEQYGIPTKSDRAANLTGASSADYSSLKFLRAGEDYNVEIEPVPWFADKNNLEVTWESDNPFIATVEASQSNPFEAVITARQGTYAGEELPNGQTATEYVANYDGTVSIRAKVKMKGSLIEYTTSISVYVFKEFETQAGSLTEYNGMRKVVNIPDNLGIKTIANYCFNSRKDITKVTVPEGVETIGYASFAYMRNLKEVYLPSTIKHIDNWAFAAYSSVRTGLSTSLQIVDTTSFVEPVHVGERAFVNQRALGTTLTIVNGSGGSFNLIDSKLDTSKMRVIGAAAFAYTTYLTDIDLSGCRSMGTLAFCMTGFYAAYNAGVYTEVKLGPKTVIGELGLLQTGVRTLDIPMSRVANMAFLDSVFLESVVFTADDLVIEDEAFYNEIDDAEFKLLTSVTFNGSVEYIGKGAFGANTNLATVTFDGNNEGKTVKYIDDGAFEDCVLTGTFTLPEGLEYLGTDALRGSSITTLQIPAGLTTDIENLGAFYSTSLETIEVLGDNDKYSVEDGILIKKIDGTEDYEMVLLPYLKNLTNGLFTVPDKVTKIGSYAFASNKYITEIDLNNVREVGVGALAFMESLETVTLSSYMTVIPAEMLYGCTKLTSVLNTDHIIEVGAYAFAGGYVSDIIDKKSVIMRYSVPLESISLAACQIIGEGAFSYTDLKSFTIPLGVEVIADYAFYFCTSLTSVNFHDEVNAIGKYAFAYTGIENLDSSTSGIKYVGKGAFECDDIDTVYETQTGLTHKMESAIRTVNLPSAEYIGESAFATYYGAGKITSLSIPNAERIESKAFNYQSNITAVSLNSTEYIGSYAFAGTGLKSAPSQMMNVKSIGYGAFYDCENMSGTFQIPKTASYVGPMAFAYTNISAFTVEGGQNYKAIAGVLFRNYTSGTELSHYPTGGDVRNNNYEVPEGTTRIGESAFTTVQTVNSVTLPSTLTHIGDKAFFGSTVSVYRFMSLEAPVLESGAAGFDYNDMNNYYWAVYANFYNYFSPVAPTSDGDYYFFTQPYRYNTITSKYYTDTWIYGTYFNRSNYTEYIVTTTINGKTYVHSGVNNTVTGGGNMSDDNKYGLIMLRPGNGIGYTDFIYAYYFDYVFLTTELMEAPTQNVINLISALPESNKLTIANRTAVETAYNAYTRLTVGQQALVSNYSKLTSAKKAMDELISQIDHYTVVFQVDEKLYGTMQTIEKGGLVTMPSNPSPKAGAQFDGWYFGNIRFDENTPVTQDMLLIAKWTVGTSSHTVSFVGVGTSVANQSVTDGSYAEKPTDPTRTGYTFNGWYNGDAKYDFDTPVTEDIVLVADWTLKKSCGTVAFGSGFSGGMLAAIISVTTMLVLAALVLLKKRAVKNR